MLFRSIPEEWLKKLAEKYLTEEEKKQIEEEARQVEATAKLRDEDYQLAYAVDILKGLSAVDFRADAVPESVKPAVTGEGAADGDAPGGTQDQDSGGASRQ